MCKEEKLKEKGKSSTQGTKMANWKNKPCDKRHMGNIMPRKSMKTILRKTLQMNQTRILKQVQEPKERQENATV